MSAVAPLPAPVPPAPLAAALAGYGNELLHGIARLVPSPDAQGTAAGDALLAVLAQIALALQSANPAQLRRQTGWWGRLLGRDVEQQVQGDALQQQLGVLQVQATTAAAAVQARAQAGRAAVAASEQAAVALDQWADAGTTYAAQLPSDGTGELQRVFAQRLDHLRRLAALQRTTTAHWQLLQVQDDDLLARCHRILQVLLPAWQQAALARQARGQVRRNQQAAQLQAQVSAEVAAAQARLP